MTALPLYVLAGGHSTRFGADKARVLLDGTPLVMRVVVMLEAVTTAATIVADVAGKYDDLELRTIEDRSADAGPMGGLDAALADRGPGHLLLTSCDLVTARPGWVGPLRDAAGETGSAAFRSPSGWEPLFALYHSSLAALVGVRLAGQDLSLQSLLEAGGAAPVALPADWPELNQINTPADLRDAIDLRDAGNQPPM